MRHAFFAFVFLLAVVGVNAPSAQAGVTCRLVPSWCPPDGDKDDGPSRVPEPGTLTVLALGAGAAALARRRRRK